MSNRNHIILPEGLLDNLPNKRPKPYFLTWLKLKKAVECGFIKNISKNKHRIAKEIGVSERTLRNHLHQMLEEKLVFIENDTLRLVSKWRTNYHDYTSGGKKFSANKVRKKRVSLKSLTDLKEAVVHTRVSSQLAKQRYAFKQKNKGKEKIPRSRQIAKQIFNNYIESGNIRNQIEGKLIADPDAHIKSARFVSRLYGEYLSRHEGKQFDKHSKVGVKKLAQITGYNSLTSIRKYKKRLISKGSLEEKRAKLRRVIKYEFKDGVKVARKVKFTPHYHIMDKFGNVYRKDCNMYIANPYHLNRQVGEVAKVGGCLKSVNQISI